MWLGTGVPKATQSLRVARRCGWARRCRRLHKACVSQSDVARHDGAKGNTKLACRKAMWLGTKVLKATQSLRVARRCGWARRCRRLHKACVSQSDVARHDNAKGNTKLACRKAMWLGTKVLKATQSLRVARRCGWARKCRGLHKACVSQSDVARHDGAKGNTKLACRKALWLGTKVLKATQSLRVARQCGWERRCRRLHKACVSQSDVARHDGAKGNTKLACRKSDVARHDDAKGNTKLTCCKAMWLGTKVLKATQSLRVARRCGWVRRCRRLHKACVSQSDVARHDNAKGNTKLACRKVMWLGTKVPKATQSLRVARRCGWARRCRRLHKACVS
ncbi:unnamed protein product [Prunus armeniaca]